MQQVETKKVVALISGGKDSCFNMMHCVANGYQIAALANLYPVNSDEKDSHMYQSVGHDIIPLYAECMDVPLYRQVMGDSINISQDYTPTDGLFM
jgi:diphthine-ammonia ligase